MSVATHQVLADVEAERRDTDPGLESRLSVNDWIKRIQGAAIQAQRSARSGSFSDTYDAWIELCAIAAGAAETTMARWRESEPDGAPLLAPGHGTKPPVSPDHSVIVQVTGTKECFISLRQQMPANVSLALLPTGQILASTDETEGNVLAEPTQWLYYDGQTKEVGVRKEVVVLNRENHK